MKKIIAGLAVAAALFASAAPAQPAPTPKTTPKPTIVLVHGAFADASSWNGVVTLLQKDGYTVVAAANPLRGVHEDAIYIGDILAGISTPVVLVGHSYGGSVISEAAAGRANVRALVYVAAFAPETGETAVGLSNALPGSTLGPTLAPPVALAGGGTDLYIRQDRFPAQFAADVPAAQARLMAATQRPVTVAALNEPARAAAWKTIPSWFVYGDRDRNIPPAELAAMADRAHARATLVVKGASHVVMVSNPRPVASIIEAAAAGR